MPQRIEWVDWLKYIGILAVILGHIASPLSGFIFSWHMPLFFFLSGFFIRMDEFPSHFIFKQTKRLLVPYILFSLVGLIAGIAKNYFLHRPSLPMFLELKSIFVSMHMSALMHHYGFVLWFLPTLFWARIAVYVLQKYCHIGIQAVCVLGVFGASFFCSLPFALDTAMNALFWVYLGNVLFPYISLYKKGMIVVVVSSMLVLLGTIYSVPVLNMATIVYDNVFYTLFWASGCILVLLSICQIIAKHVHSTHISTCASHTFFLFIAHPYTNNIAYIIGGQFHIQYWYVTLGISLALLYASLECYRLLREVYQKHYV